MVDEESWALSSRGPELKENKGGLNPQSMHFLKKQTENMFPVLTQVESAKGIAGDSLG